MDRYIVAGISLATICGLVFWFVLAKRIAPDTPCWAPKFTKLELQQIRIERALERESKRSKTLQSKVARVKRKLATASQQYHEYATAKLRYSFHSMTERLRGDEQSILEESELTRLYPAGSGSVQDPTTSVPIVIHNSVGEEIYGKAWEDGNVIGSGLSVQEVFEMHPLEAHSLLNQTTTTTG